MDASKSARPSNRIHIQATRSSSDYNKNKKDVYQLQLECLTYKDIEFAKRWLSLGIFSRNEREFIPLERLLGRAHRLLSVHKDSIPLLLITHSNQILRPAFIVKLICLRVLAMRPSIQNSVMERCVLNVTCITEV